MPSDARGPRHHTGEKASDTDVTGARACLGGYGPRRRTERHGAGSAETRKVRDCITLTEVEPWSGRTRWLRSCRGRILTRFGNRALSSVRE